MKLIVKASLFFFLLCTAGALRLRRSFLLPAESVNTHRLSDSVSGTLDSRQLLPSRPRRRVTVDADDTVGVNEDDDDDDKCRQGRRSANPGPGWTAFWIFLVFYLFVGTAIVCDELFIPALELISSKWNLSDDVAGATLMAAGGSAPELATSLISTFTESDIGFGTIVGSAIFNVLFVIGMCALFTPKDLVPLKLTWWPLARDSAYYVLTLFALACWFQLPLRGRPGIQLWEAILQFGLYVGYVVLMSQNEKLEAFMRGIVGNGCPRVFPTPEEESHSDNVAKDDANGRRGEKADELSVACSDIFKAALGDHDDTRRPSFTEDMQKIRRAQKETNSLPRRSLSLNRPTGFRAGILQLLMGEGGSIANTTGVAVVTEISGDVDATFAKLDRDKNGRLDLAELKRLLIMLGGCEEDYSEAAVSKLREELDTNNDGFVSKAEFSTWYIKSESRLKHKAKWLFDQFDKDSDGVIGSADVGDLIKAIMGHPNEALLASEVRSAVEEFTNDVARGGGGCKFDQFQAWYEKSGLWQQARDEAEVAANAAEGMLSSVVKQMREFASLSAFERCIFVALLPLNASLAVTVPDCRPPGNEHRCYLTFFASIAWIGAYSWFMVEGITQIGEQLGISTFMMGLTWLAAGTSVPDLLSSVVVAKQGKGDMAVSSSIGSNIFDVGVGLPLPWILYTIVNWPQPVAVCNKGLTVSIAILLLMVIIVISAIVTAGWKMSHSLGIFMFLLYCIYVTQEVLRG